jgi:hypothetical protein
MAANPVEGWYPAPSKEGFLRWWDGTAWSAHEKPEPVALAVPEHAPPVGPPVGSAPSIPKPTKAQTVTKTLGASGFAVAGAALAADGAFGLGKTRKGLNGLGKYFIWAAVLLIIGFVSVIAGVGSAIAGNTEDSPLPGGILFGLVGVLVLVIGVFKLALRAGSVAAGILLIREGMKRGKSVGDV